VPPALGAEAHTSCHRDGIRENDLAYLDADRRSLPTRASWAFVVQAIPILPMNALATTRTTAKSAIAGRHGCFFRPYTRETQMWGAASRPAGQRAKVAPHRVAALRGTRLAATNYMMLDDYMLMRGDGREIFKNHQSRVHRPARSYYHGLLGTDVACLCGDARSAAQGQLGRFAAVDMVLRPRSRPGGKAIPAPESRFLRPSDRPATPPESCHYGNHESAGDAAGVRCRLRQRSRAELAGF